VGLNARQWKCQRSISYHLRCELIARETVTLEHCMTMPTRCYHQASASQGCCPSALSTSASSCQLCSLVRILLLLLCLSWTSSELAGSFG